MRIKGKVLMIDDDLVETMNAVARLTGYEVASSGDAGSVRRR